METDLKPQRHIVIKGSFYSFDRVFVRLPFSAAATIFLVYTTAVSDLQFDSTKYQGLLYSTLGFMRLTSILYWMLTSYCYYYEFKEDKVDVRNLIRPYF